MNVQLTKPRLGYSKGAELDLHPVWARRMYRAKECKPVNERDLPFLTGETDRIETASVEPREEKAVKAQNTPRKPRRRRRKTTK